MRDREKFATGLLGCAIAALYLLLQGTTDLSALRERVNQTDSVRVRQVIGAVTGMPTRDVTRNRYGLAPIPDATPTVTSGPGFTVSIATQEEFLFSQKQGILSQARKADHRSIRNKGRLWEHPAVLRIRRPPATDLRGIVGLRTHGDVKPATREAFHREACLDSGRDFRIYNRSSVRPMVLPEDFLPGPSPRRFHSLVIRKKQAERNYLAFSIAREIGASVPDFQLARFFLNGHDLCVALVVEHLNHRQMGRLVDPQGPFNRFKDPTLKSQTYWALTDWLNSGPSYPEIERRIDLDSLISNLFSIWYLGNRDWIQGVAAKSRESGKWVWILWDLDTTLREQEFSADFFPIIARHRNPRSRLFLALLQFPAFRDRLRTEFRQRIEHRLTPVFYQTLFDSLKRLSPDFAEAATFEELLSRRNMQVARELEQVLQRFDRS